MHNKPRVLRPSGFESSPTTICDLASDAPTLRKALPYLESYLNDRNRAEPKSLRRRLVEYVIEEMVRRHKITRNSQKYVIINDFYLRVFGTEAPYYRKVA